jgi:histidyl-tRNA synthetase
VQIDADPATWTPSDEDLYVKVTGVSPE